MKHNPIIVIFETTDVMVIYVMAVSHVEKIIQGRLGNSILLIQLFALRNIYHHITKISCLYLI